MVERIPFRGKLCAALVVTAVALYTTGLAVGLYRQHSEKNERTSYVSEYRTGDLREFDPREHGR